MLGFPIRVGNGRKGRGIRLPETMYKYDRDFIERMVTASGKWGELSSAQPV